MAVAEDATSYRSLRQLNAVLTELDMGVAHADTTVLTVDQGSSRASELTPPTRRRAGEECSEAECAAEQAEPDDGQEVPTTDQKEPHVEREHHDVSEEIQDGASVHTLTDTSMEFLYSREEETAASQSGSELVHVALWSSLWRAGRCSQDSFSLAACGNA